MGWGDPSPSLGLGWAMLGNLLNNRGASLVPSLVPAVPRAVQLTFPWCGVVVDV